jgi:hypothetical protein
VCVEERDTASEGNLQYFTVLFPECIKPYDEVNEIYVKQFRVITEFFQHTERAYETKGDLQ